LSRALNSDTEFKARAIDHEHKPPSFGLHSTVYADAVANSVAAAGPCRRNFRCLMTADHKIVAATAQTSGLSANRVVHSSEGPGLSEYPKSPEFPTSEPRLRENCRREPGLQSPPSPSESQQPGRWLSAHSESRWNSSGYRLRHDGFPRDVIGTMLPITTALM
jgi:hypothetical protein